MWEEGSVVIDGARFLYNARVFDEGSRFGINRGRISKLKVVKDIGDNSWSMDNVVIQYDREWVIHPETDLTKKVLTYIIELYK